MTKEEICAVFLAELAEEPSEDAQVLWQWCQGIDDAPRAVTGRPPGAPNKRKRKRGEEETVADAEAVSPPKRRGRPPNRPVAPEVAPQRKLRKRAHVISGGGNTAPKDGLGSQGWATAAVL